MRANLTWSGRSRPIAAAILLLLDVAGAPGAAAEDWPKWRGPNGDGVSTESGWQSRFPAGGPRVLWQRDVGFGYAAVAVSSGRLYTAGWSAGEEHIYCLNEGDGKPIWDKSYPAKRHNCMHEGGPAATPEVDGDRVYSVGKEGVLVCLDADDGKPRWDRRLPGEFGVSIPQWGFAGSPVVLGDALLVDVGRIIALDKMTGEKIWRTDDYGPAYSTPTPFKHRGRQLIAAFPAYGLVVLDATTGRELASHAWETSYKVNAATPIVVGDRIFITSGYGKGAALLRFDGRRLTVIWENIEMRSKMSTPVLIAGHLYGFDDKRLKCLDFATGERKWVQAGLGLGCLMAADGKLIILSEDGKLAIADASPSAYTQISGAQILDASDCWTMPVLASGRIYCRSSKGQLVCLDVRGAESQSR